MEQAEQRSSSDGELSGDDSPLEFENRRLWATDIPQHQPTHIVVKDCWSSDWTETIWEMSCIRSLRSLQLVGSSLSNYNIQNLMRMRNLTTLILDNNQLNESCLDTVCELKKLTKLSIVGNPINKSRCLPQLRKLLKNCKQLKELDLPLETVSSLALAGFESNSHFWLGIPGFLNEIEKVVDNWECPLFLNCLQNLQQMVLYAVGMSSAAVLVNCMAELPQLHTVYIIRCKIPINRIQQLGRIATLSSLTLKDCNITEGWQTEQCEPCGTKQVTIVQCNIRLRQLCKLLRTWPMLTYLKLIGTLLTPEVVRTIATRMPLLEQLYIDPLQKYTRYDHSRVTREMAVLLARGLPNLWTLGLDKQDKRIIGLSRRTHAYVTALLPQCNLVRK